MTKYPLKVLNHQGFFSVYALSIILGFDYRGYLKMLAWLSRNIASSDGKYDKGKFQASPYRRVIKGWVFFHHSIIDKYLKRLRLPSLNDVFDESRPELSLIEYSFEDFKLSKKIGDYPRQYQHIQRNIHTISKESHKITRKSVFIKRQLYIISRIK